jgi:hypothetical protein
MHSLTQTTSRGIPGVSGQQRQSVEHCRTLSAGAARTCPACTASITLSSAQQQWRNRSLNPQPRVHLAIAAATRTSHVPSSGSRTPAAATRAVAAVRAAAESATSAPDLDPQVYLDPAVSPTPFVGPIAVNHIPGKQLARFTFMSRVAADACCLPYLHHIEATCGTINSVTVFQTKCCYAYTCRQGPGPSNNSAAAARSAAAGYTPTGASRRRLG